MDRYGTSGCGTGAVIFLVGLLLAAVVCFIFVARAGAQEPEYGWDWWAVPQTSNEYSACFETCGHDPPPPFTAFRVTYHFLYWNDAPPQRIYILIAGPVADYQRPGPRYRIINIEPDGWEVVGGEDVDPRERYIRWDGADIWNYNLGYTAISYEIEFDWLPQDMYRVPDYDAGYDALWAYAFYPDRTPRVDQMRFHQQLYCAPCVWYPDNWHTYMPIIKKFDIGRVTSSEGVDGASIKHGLHSPEFHDPVVIKRMRCNGYRTRGHPGYGHYAASRRGYWSR